MVWPAVRDDCLTKIQEANPRVAFLDAALLLEAGWADALHEVWVTFVPEEEVGFVISHMLMKVIC